MRYIYVILTVLVLSSACKSQSSPNTPAQIPSATLPASPNTPTVVQPTPPPKTIQPTTSHSDEATRVERDAYKEVVKAHQETLNTIKWAIGIIGPLILVLVGYVVFKNNKEYKDALEQAKEARNDAKEACKDARHWESESKRILENIDKQVKAELETIEKRGKESVREIVAQTQTEIRRGELWSNALNLDNKGKYDEASDKYAELVKLRPDDYLAYTSWGTSLVDWARLKKDEKLFELACQKFQQATSINPHMRDAYCNWGAALEEWAEIKDDEKLFEQACQKSEQAINIDPNMYEAYINWGSALGYIGKLKNDEKLLEQACQKYEKAIKIKPDKYEAYNNWGNAFLELAKLKKSTPERYGNLLKQAEEKCLKAESLKKGSAAYNLACIYALRGDKGKCREWLLTGQEASMLPPRDHAMKDNDLASVRNEPWFKEIKWKGEK
ncbi:MAG: tetratricopeptide repeat protein [Sedimentisphaerales bacterium]|nr:tetratricopeptide repeat protein [Sedimentisphaerales bacterium]